MLLPFDVGYVQCPKCRRVSHTGALWGEPSPCCNVLREDCEPWPTFEIYKILQLVNNQDLDSSDGQRQAIVFLCTMLEMLLEISLWELLNLYTNHEKLIEVILKAYRGRDDRIGLYKKLSHQSLEKLFSSKKDLKTFLKDWKTIADRRNKFIHRGDYSKSDEDEMFPLIQSVREKSLIAFVEVHNDIQEMRTDFP